MKKPDLRRSPLGDWLDENEMSPRAFAERLTLVRRAHTHPSNVSQWANSRQDPSDAMISDIEAATQGAVKPEQWDCWRRRQARRARRSA